MSRAIRDKNEPFVTPALGDRRKKLMGGREGGREGGPYLEGVVGLGSHRAFRGRGGKSAGIDLRREGGRGGFMVCGISCVDPPTLPPSLSPSLPAYRCLGDTLRVVQLQLGH